MILNFKHGFLHIVSKGEIFVSLLITTAAVSQWVRALALQAEGWVFESQPRQT